MPQRMYTLENQIPVSYTHLDVYKRQQWAWGSGDPLNDAITCIMGQHALFSRELPYGTHVAHKILRVTC